MLSKGLLFQYSTDRIKGQLLDWSKRLKIIKGLVEGLVYLHKHPMLSIVHRDLKPNNILLDYNLNPRIADFGSARALSSDIAEGRTSRVVGTWYQLPTILIITYSHHLFSDVLILQFWYLLFHFSVVTKLQSMHLEEFTRWRQMCSALAFWFWWLLVAERIPYSTSEWILLVILYEIWVKTYISSNIFSPLSVLENRLSACFY